MSLPIAYDPFVQAKRIIKKAKRKSSHPSRPKKILHLGAIFDHKAVINGRFLAVGDRVAGYRVAFIGTNFVVLQKGKKKKLLTFKKKNILKMEKR